MGPKVEAAASFAASGEGRIAAIGALEEAALVLRGAAGTRIEPQAAPTRYWDEAA